MTGYRSKFLNILKERGFVHDCTDFEGLDKYLADCENSGKSGVAYIGFDCTAPSLHAGSLMQIMALRHLQKCGHKAIVLIGGGTTKIGDPSGKDETRRILTDKEINQNKKGIKKVFDKYLKKYQLVDNGAWLESLNSVQFLQDIGKHFSINRMLTLDSVKSRLERDQEMTFLEFNYMIMQAYDFVELAKKYGCRLQIGGSDQWGNIVNGTDLWRRMNAVGTGKIGQAKIGAEKLFGLTTPLLTTSSGAKMGKTSEGAIWLDAELLKPYDYWQYWRNTDDADVSKFLKLFTELSLEDIGKHLAGNINEAKIVLANEATKMLHGEKAAKDAEETARKVFEQGGIGGDLPVHKVDKTALAAGIPVAQLFTESALTTSNGEAKKLIQGGGAKINDQKISEIGLMVNSSHMKDGAIKLSAGKKRHALVKIK